MLRGVIFDIDGTLVDSDDAHAESWVDTFAEAGYDVPFSVVRPLIGMGGDKLLPKTVGIRHDSKEGKKLTNEELQGLLKAAQVADLIEEKATASDAKRSKPDPDIVEAAIEEAEIEAADLAGAVEIYDGPAHLLANYESSLLGRKAG